MRSHQGGQHELPEVLQYLQMYVRGMMRTPILAPIMQTPSRSQYLDMVGELKFQVNAMSPEEVVPFFYPQIYDVSDPNLTD